MVVVVVAAAITFHCWFSLRATRPQTISVGQETYFCAIWECFALGTKVGNSFSPSGIVLAFRMDIFGRFLNSVHEQGDYYVDKTNAEQTMMQQA